VKRETHWKRSLWILGGLALGGIAALVVGVLVFWVQPTVRRARSPLGEHLAPPLVVRYAKTSAVAGNVAELADRARRQWLEVLRRLGLQDASFPERIHLYLYASPEELGLGLSDRLEEEATLVAVVDLLASQPWGGALARLACSLALGRPGNPVFPRGLALYFDAPEHPWMAEAGAWLTYVDPQVLWAKGEALLPHDPWERLYFQVNAPWVGATPTWETLRNLLQISTQSKEGKGRVWEVLAAAQAQWVLQTLGASGVRAFWRASSWEGASLALGRAPERLWADFRSALQESFDQSPQRLFFSALCDLYRGRAQAALSQLLGLEGEEVREARALAWLALGEVARFCEEKGDCPPELASLAEAPRVRQGRWCAVGPDIGEGDLQRGVQSAQRLLALWHADESVLPERITFYVVPSIPNLQPPWGVFWVSAPAEIPERAARLVLEAFSPLGGPAFPTLVEGLVLWAVDPARDFRAEARKIWEEGRWVSLTQPLFGVYPRALAEAEAGALVTFLLERHGSSSIPRLWEALLSGASVFRASQEVLGLPWYQLEADLLAWIRQP